MLGDIPEDGYVLIIGAMKCGTSSLYEYLKGHPQLCPAITKEPEFFSNHQRHGVRVDGTAVERYEDLWDFDPSTHRYVMEASTGYAKFPVEKGVPEKIYRYGIKPKFIYIVRNPFDRITSHFNYMQRDASFDLDIVDDHLINTSNYFLQLEQYRRFFPSRDILILDFDELKAQPARALSRVWGFLGISANHTPPLFGIANATRAQTRIERYIKRSALNGVGRYVPEALKRSAQQMLAKVSPAETRSLSITEQAFVKSRLQDDMADFARRYGFDVRKWGFEAPSRSAPPLLVNRA